MGQRFKSSQARLIKLKGVVVANNWKERISHLEKENDIKVVKRGPMVFKVYINVLRRTVVARLIKIYDVYPFNLFNINEKSRGRSKCSREDAWNEKIGVGLAVDQLIIKITNQTKKHITKLLGDVDKACVDNLIRPMENKNGK